VGVIPMSVLSYPKKIKKKLVSYTPSVVIYNTFKRGYYLKLNGRVIKNE